jgi:hypothetical protein
MTARRYFAIVFPTEYQRHAVRTNASGYIVGVWLMALAVSSPAFMERYGGMHTLVHGITGPVPRVTFVGSKTHNT